MTKYILGNWKMHGLGAEAVALGKAVGAQAMAVGTQVILFPPATALYIVGREIQNSAVKLGAQDCSPELKGAHTGDISAPMLKDIGCSYVIIGHSERRAHHAETSALVQQKAQIAMENGLIPVICVGENMEERESGKYLQAIELQVKNSLPILIHSDAYIIAYEPVWAIGSGKTPTTAEISEVHKTIASLLTYATSGARTAIVYGGSVKAANAREILAEDSVDGVLVGGASLDAMEFGKIIKAAEGF